MSKLILSHTWIILRNIQQLLKLLRALNHYHLSFQYSCSRNKISQNSRNSSGCSGNKKGYTATLKTLIYLSIKMLPNMLGSVREFRTLQGIVERGQHGNPSLHPPGISLRNVCPLLSTLPFYAHNIPSLLSHIWSSSGNSKMCSHFCLVNFHSHIFLHLWGVPQIYGGLHLGLDPVISQQKVLIIMDLSLSSLAPFSSVLSGTGKVHSWACRIQLCGGLIALWLEGYSGEETGTRSPFLPLLLAWCHWQRRKERPFCPFPLPSASSQFIAVCLCKSHSPGK